MSRTLFNALMLAALGASLSGCAMTQAISDTSSATARAIFYKQVKTLHLDFTARASINTAAAEMNALATSTLVRVYQLRSRDALDRTTYAALVDEGASALQVDRLHEQALVVKPGEGAQLSMALDKDAQFVAVVALFREPDTQAATWRLVLGRDDLDPDRARVIELADNRLSLRPLAKD
ncbi:type VI secretion system lipoprotein TssJ [Pseudomonas sp. IT-P176]|uniref:type VI secretion system lipoprotein TssJ n=1 Tax=Pseudomonas sp. IT-P176 TaxID=3026444 RepID=UPI0039E14696